MKYALIALHRLQFRCGRCAAFCGFIPVDFTPAEEPAEQWSQRGQALDRSAPEGVGRETVIASCTTTFSIRERCAARTGLRV